jgi:hypothetical protein
VTALPTADDEGLHFGAVAEEWSFSFWRPDGTCGGYTSLVLANGAVSYFAAIVRVGEPLLHVSDVDGPPLRSAEHLIVKSEGLWAEHICEVPFEQWTIANETYAVALDDPDDVFGRSYGTPTPFAFDLEWYATARPEPIEAGYCQLGVVEAHIELPGTPLAGEFQSARSHRWGSWVWDSDESGIGLRAPVLINSRPIERRLTSTGWSPSPF